VIGNARLAAIFGLALQLGCRVSHQATPSDPVTVKASLAAIDPLIGPDRGVGTPIIGRAAGDQRLVSVAYSGASYLAVWEDHRAPSAYYSLFATRLDTSGRVQDPTGIAIGSGESPVAVWDGMSFLIVYCMNDRVVGRRLRPDGTFVDALRSSSRMERRRLRSSLSAPPTTTARRLS
jgi:hypothetical protein